MSAPINFSHLPQISLSKLYESSVSDKSASFNTTEITGKAHHEDIIVQSPFYERPQNCKGPCTCAYHRMKRYKQLANILRFQQNNKIKDQISQYKSRIAAAVRGSNYSSKPKCQQVIYKPRKYRQTQKIALCDLQNKERRIKKKYNLDHYNHYFEEILRKRLQPMQDHEKVASLIKFIKISSTINPNYLKKIRDYISLNLLKIVQKIPFAKLLEAGEDNEEVLKKIANVINGKPEQALEFLRGVKQSMKDMELYIIQRSGMKLKEDLDEQGQKFLNQDAISKDDKSRKGNSKTQKSLFNQSNQKLDIQTEKNSNNLLLEQLKFKNEKEIQTNAEEKIHLNNPPLSPKKRGTFPSKKSNMTNHQNSLLFENNIKSNSRSTFKQSLDLFKQLQKKKGSVNYDQRNLLSIQKENLQEKKDKYRNSSILLLKKKSSRRLQEPEERTQEILTENQTIKIKIKVSGQGKRRVVSKIKHPPNPFNSISYSNLITKEEFDRVKYLLSQHNKIPIDLQMQKLLNLIEKRLSAKPQFLEQFIEMFSSVLTPDQIKTLRQKHNDNQYKKMIQKLTRQVDNCLNQLKQSTQNVYKEYQQQNIERSNFLLRNLLNMERISSDQTLFDSFNKFKIVEKTPPPAPPVEESLLDQKQLGDLFVEQIIELPEFKLGYLKEASIKNRKSNDQQEDLQNLKLDEQKHRQILRYMKKHHPTAFNSVKQNIKDTLNGNNQNS